MMSEQKGNEQIRNVVMVIAILACIVLCGFLLYPKIVTKSPSEIIEEYLEYYKNAEYEKMKEMCDINPETMVLEKTMNMEEIEKCSEFSKALLSESRKFSFKILNEDINKKKANIRVKIIGENFYPGCIAAIPKIAEQAEKDHLSYRDEEGMEYDAFSDVEEIAKGLTPILRDIDEPQDYEVTFELTKIKNEWRIKNYAKNKDILNALSGNMLNVLAESREKFSEAFDAALQKASAEYFDQLEAEWEAELANMKVSSYEEAYNYADQYLLDRTEKDDISRSIETLLSSKEKAPLTVTRNGQEIKTQGWYFSTYTGSNDMGYVKITEDGDLYALDSMTRLLVLGAQPTYKYNVFGK